jgi:hypothetical protein
MVKTKLDKSATSAKEVALVDKSQGKKLLIIKKLFIRKN